MSFLEVIEYQNQWPARRIYLHIFNDICIYVYIHAHTYAYMGYHIEYTHTHKSYLYVSSLHFKHYFPTSQKWAIPYFKTNEHDQLRCLLSSCSDYNFVSRTQMGSNWYEGFLFFFFWGICPNSHCSSNQNLWALPKILREKRFELETWLTFLLLWGQVCLFLLSLHGSFHRCYSSSIRWCGPRGSRKRPAGSHRWWIPGTLRMTMRTILHGWIWGVNTLYSTWFKAKLAFIYKAWDFIAFRSQNSVTTLLPLFLLYSRAPGHEIIGFPHQLGLFWKPEKMRVIAFCGVEKSSWKGELRFKSLRNRWLWNPAAFLKDGNAEVFLVGCHRFRNSICIAEM